MRLGRWQIGGRETIPHYSHDDLSEVWLTRWTVAATPWFSIFVYRLETADPRDSLHDHAWPHLTIVLRGGYRERRDYDSCEVHVRWLDVKRSTGAHLITGLDRAPTWALVVAGRPCRAAGYRNPDGSWIWCRDHRHQAELDAATAEQNRSGMGEGAGP